MIIGIQKNDTDCEVAALSSACQKTYEEVYKAEGRRELPGKLNDPVWGNPETLYLTLIKLGFWKRNITWNMLLNKQAEVNKTVILIHFAENPILYQHYIVLAEYVEGGFRCYWGDSVIPRFITTNQMKDYFLGGFPNCAFQVIKDTAWERFKRWLGVSK